MCVCKWRVRFMFLTIQGPKWDQPISDTSIFFASGRMILMHRTHFMQNIKAVFQSRDQNTYDAVSDLMHKWVAQRPDFKNAVRVVKMVLNTQFYQYIWLTIRDQREWVFEVREVKSENKKLSLFFEKCRVKKNAFTLFREVQSEIKILRDRDREVKILENS